MKTLCSLLALSLFTLLGCKESEMNLETLAGQKFILIPVDGGSYSNANAPIIEFGDHSMLFGKICNTFRGPAELKDGILTLKNAAITKMMCIDSDLNELETLMLNMLTQGVRVSMEKSRLILTRGSDALIFFADGKK